jgi:hypothetical protein
LAVTTIKAIYDAFVLLGDYLSNAFSAWIDGLKIFGGALQDIGQIVKAVFSGDFADARVLFDGMLAHLKNNFQGFKDGIANIGQGLKEDWKKLWDDLAKGPTAPMLFQGPSIGAPNVEPVKPIKSKLELTTVTDSIDKRDNQDQIRAMDLVRQFRTEQLDGVAQQMAAQDDLYSKRLEQIGKLNISEEQSLMLSEQANRAHTKSVKNLYANQISTISDMFGAFGNLAQAIGKKNTAAYKAMMYVQAIVSTAAGVARAFADYAWPYSMIVAATVGVAGAAQIATIASAGQAHAGAEYIPQEATYFLQQGERVLAPKQNEDLTNFLEGNGNGQVGGQTLISIALNVEGRELARVIHDMARNGQLTIDPRAIREGI